eukprot:scpid28562/ scgid4959/ Hepatocyte nuclear factor 4-beta; Nuclear receptor subfamily 2 group A member 3
MEDSSEKGLPAQRLTVKLEDGGAVHPRASADSNTAISQAAGLPMAFLPHGYAPIAASALSNIDPTAAALLASDPTSSVRQFEEKQHLIQMQQQRIQQLQKQQQQLAQTSSDQSYGDTGSNRGSRPVSPSSGHVSATSSAENLMTFGHMPMRVPMMQFIGAQTLSSGYAHGVNPVGRMMPRQALQLAESEQRMAAELAETASAGRPSRPVTPSTTSAAADSTAAASAVHGSVCGVCGDQSQNIRKHYGANSCEACKCFFRRSVQMDKQYQCRYSMKCPIGVDKRVRHWCQFCRFQKCITVGMKKEAVKLHRNTFLSSTSGRSSPVTTGKAMASEASTHPLAAVSPPLSSPPLQSKSPRMRDIPSVTSPPLSGAFATNPPSPMESEARAADRIKAELSPGLLSASIEAASAAAAPGSTYMPSYAPLHHLLPDAPDLIPSSSLHMGGGDRGAGGSGNPQTGPSSSSSLGSDAFPMPPMPNVNVPTPERAAGEENNEASVEEVLETFKHRILCLFQWSKQHVVGFSDLSPADQKSLLRSSVVEIVMLGFAKRSIGFDGSLQLVTGKMMSPGHVNPGVSSVANLLIDRVVKPLRQLNLNDYEHMLLKQVILFNPVSAGVQDIETVRSMRKIRLIELQEYTSGAEPGRMGEMLLLIPPLYEVSQEIVEQLRLEQFVNDGEMRFDAVLLMSIVNGEVSLTNVDATADPAVIITPPASKPPPSVGAAHHNSRSTAPSLDF